MKKVLLLLIVLFGSLFLVGCTEKKAKADFLNIRPNRETIEFDVKISDPDLTLKENTAVVDVTKADKTNIKTGVKYKTDKGEGTFYFRIDGLERGVGYVFTLRATKSADSSSFELGKTSVTTTTGGDNNEDPILITSPEEFLEMDRSPNSYFRLENDIDFNYRRVLAAEFFSTGSTSSSFRGMLDGNGKTLKNLIVYTQSGDRPTNLGLFGFISSSLEDVVSIKDLTLDNVSIEAGSYYGVVNAGILSGKVSNDSAIENVVIKNSKLTIELNSTSETPSNIGGAIGSNEGSAKNIITVNTNIEVNVRTNNSFNIGGAIGQLSSTSANQKISEMIGSDTNISLNGQISSETTSIITGRIGGAIGQYNNQKELENVYSTGNILVSGFLYNTGRYNRDGGTFTDALEGEKSASDRLIVGGLIGEVTQRFKVYNGFTTSDIDVTVIDPYGRIEDLYVGGVIGRADLDVVLEDLVRAGQTSSTYYEARGKIKVNSNALNVFASQNQAVKSTNVDLREAGKLYGGSSLTVNGTTYSETVEVGSVNDAIKSEFLINAFNSSEVRVAADVYGDALMVYTDVYDPKASFNDLVLELYKAAELVARVNISQKAKLFKNYFSELDSDTLYKVIVKANGTSVVTKEFQTHNHLVSILGEEIKETSYAASVIIDKEPFDEKQITILMYKNGVLERTITTTNDAITYNRLESNTEYEFIYKTYITGTEFYLGRKIVKTLDTIKVEFTFNNKTATKLSFSFGITGNTVDNKILGGNETNSSGIVEYVPTSGMYYILYQNGTVVERGDIKSLFETTYNFEHLTENTKYRVLVFATVNQMADVLIFDSANTNMFISTKDVYSNLPTDLVITESTITFSVDVLGNEEREVTDFEIVYQSKFGEEVKKLDLTDGKLFINLTGLGKNNEFKVILRAKLGGKVVILLETTYRTN